MPSRLALAAAIIVACIAACIPDWDPPGGMSCADGCSTSSTQDTGVEQPDDPEAGAWQAPSTASSVSPGRRGPMGRSLARPGSAWLPL